MAGYDFGKRYATFTVSANRGLLNWPILMKLEWGLLRHLWLPMIEITDDKLADYARRIADFRPVMLRSYASTVYFLARYMVRQGMTIPVPAVITTGETLSDPMRQTIEQAFAPGRVFNEYGADGMQMAGECDHHQGLHLNAETVFVEVVRNGERVADGELGELVFTNLEATAVPFIRYNIQDVGVLTHESCPCGRGLPRLTHLEGRLTDLFATHDGRWLSVHHFTGLLGHMPAVEAFQVIQRDVNDVLLKLVVNAAFTEQDHETIVDTFANYLGPAIRLTLEFVDDIPTTPSGKRRFFISQAITGTGNTLGVTGMNPRGHERRVCRRGRGHPGTLPAPTRRRVGAVRHPGGLPDHSRSQRHAASIPMCRACVDGDGPGGRCCPRRRWARRCGGCGELDAGGKSCTSTPPPGGDLCRRWWER